MKTVLWIGSGLVVVMALVVAGLGAGWALWGRQLWAGGPAAGPVAGPAYAQGCGWGRSGSRSGMPWWGGESGARPESPPIGEDEVPSEEDAELSIEEAHEAVEQYLRSRGYADLEVAEVMAFEHNYYAIAREHETGVGAMELLVDRQSGAVGPEMGPNMMWNERYGMHGRGMMRGGGGASAIGPDQAVEIAQRWLDANRPSLSADEHADRFYGYYTIHTLEDGEIEGMLSVHDGTGQVWYHTWHGDFLGMIGGEEAH